MTDPRFTLMVGLLAALSGCAMPLLGSLASPDAEHPTDALYDFGPGRAGSGGIIVGRASWHSDWRVGPVTHALVILQGTTLPDPIDQMTDEHGRYRFDDLPPGNYTIQMLAGHSTSAMFLQLPADGRFRANFEIEPQGSSCGWIVITPDPNFSSPASSYHSSMLEFE